MDRFTKDELERRVDEVLFYKWDPIGINQYPTARAEYRSYVPVILAKLMLEYLGDIEAMLQEIGVNSMGLSPNPQAATEIAKLLLEHKKAIDGGLA